MCSWDLNCKWSLRFFFVERFVFTFPFQISLREKNIFFSVAPPPTRDMASSFLRFLDHTQRHITVSRNPLDEWSARCRDLYLTTHNTYNRQTSMPRRDSKPQSRQASSRRPTPWTARPLGTVRTEFRYFKFSSAKYSVSEKNVNHQELKDSKVNESNFVYCIISPFQILTKQIGYFTKKNHDSG